MAATGSSYKETLMAYSPNLVEQPDGTLVVPKTEGTAFETTDVLADAAVYASGVIALQNFTQLQTEVNASHDGELEFIFYSDAGGTDIVRSLTIPFVASEGFQLYSAPTFGHYVQYKFTNNSGSLQTDFFYSCKFHTNALSPQILDTTGVISPAMTTVLTRPTADFNEQRNESHLLNQESRRKFGTNNSVSASGLQTVWPYSADWVPSQVFNEKLRIKAGGDANDTAAGTGARSIQVTFLDDSWNMVQETLTTAGASASSATTANCVRLLHVDDVTSGTYHGNNIGDITLELTGGNIMGFVAAGVGSTEQAILTVPAGKTAYVTEIFVSVGQGDSCDVKMMDVKDASVVSAPFEAAHEDWNISDFSGAQVFPMHTFLKFPEKADVWFEAERITGSGSARVSIDFSYYLVDN